MTGFPPETLACLTDLLADNTKTWFDANRAHYEHAECRVGQGVRDRCHVQLGPRTHRRRARRAVRLDAGGGHADRRR